MFPPKSLKNVNRSVRNLPDPAPDPHAPATEPDADDAGGGLVCPSCGAPFSLQAVQTPSKAPDQGPQDARQDARQVGAPVTPSGGEAPEF